MCRLAFRRDLEIAEQGAALRWFQLRRKGAMVDAVGVVDLAASGDPELGQDGDDVVGRTVEHDAGFSRGVIGGHDAANLSQHVGAHPANRGSAMPFTPRPVTANTPPAVAS